MMLPGITRDNPDYFPIIIMNDILGGGGFTSRIMNRVRTEEGLAYDAHTSFPGGVYYPLTFSVGYQSKSRTVAYAASLAIEEIKKMQSAPANGSGTDDFQAADSSTVSRGCSRPRRRWRAFLRRRNSPVVTPKIRSFTKNIVRDRRGDGAGRPARGAKVSRPDKLVVLAVGNKDGYSAGVSRPSGEVQGPGGRAFHGVAVAGSDDDEAAAHWPTVEKPQCLITTSRLGEIHDLRHVPLATRGTVTSQAGCPQPIFEPPRRRLLQYREFSSEKLAKSIDFSVVTLVVSRLL